MPGQDLVVEVIGESRKVLPSMDGVESGLCELR